jgi:hypothetical protein
VSAEREGGPTTAETADDLTGRAKEEAPEACASTTGSNGGRRCAPHLSSRRRAVVAAVEGGVLSIAPVRKPRPNGL